MPEYITIHTTRNVGIEYVLAGLGDRVLAKIIDSIIIIGYIFLLVLLFSSINSFVPFFIMLVPALFFSFLFERFNNGQTPGKNIVQIKVVALDGKNITTSMYFIRWLFLLVDLRLVTGVIGIIAILVSDKSQRLGDIVAGTTVISLKAKKSIKDTVFKKINIDYLPKYVGVKMMQDRDIQTLQQVLKSQADQKKSLVQMAANQVAQSYEIEPQEDARLFLHTIISDFNYFQYQEHNNSFGKFEQNNMEE
jgi:uncharacterized RDD family membrane protein YckC